MDIQKQVKSFLGDFLLLRKYNMNHIWLLLSSLCILFPHYIYYNFCTPSPIKYLNIFSNKITSTCSLLFWSSAKKNSLFHNIDKYWVRFSNCLLIINIYNSSSEYFIKFIETFIIFCLFILILYSDYYSYNNWCCKEHIVIHFISHLMYVLLNIIFILF